MKIKVEPYNKDWVKQFEKLKSELLLLLKNFNPIIEHFGSTSVPTLAAKPVIDILVGIENVNVFDLLTQEMLPHKKYIYYQVFNKVLPQRRLYVRLKDESNFDSYENIYTQLEGIPHEQLYEHRIAHVHIWEYDSPDWIRHLAFRDYLIAHPEIRQQYENLKIQLSQKKWDDGMQYSLAKNDFIQKEEKKALVWYELNKSK